MRFSSRVFVAVGFGPLQTVRTGSILNGNNKIHRQRR